MFEISQLKEKTLVELQEIAKKIGAKKYSHLKKLDLVYLILDTQATAPSVVVTKVAPTKENKPKRKRVVKAVPKANKSLSEPTDNKEVVPEKPKNTQQPAAKKPVHTNQKKPVHTNQKKNVQTTLPIEATDSKPIIANEVSNTKEEVSKNEAIKPEVKTEQPNKPVHQNKPQLPGILE